MADTDHLMVVHSSRTAASLAGEGRSVGWVRTTLNVIRV
jgi:hypothetical protein